MGSGVCGFETIRDTAVTERFEVPGGFSRFLEYQRQAAIKMGSVQRERGRKIIRRRIPVVSDQGCGVRSLFLQRGGAMRGQDQDLGSSLIGLALARRTLVIGRTT
ncbi:MAG: hypothetical protein OXH02_07015 [Gemmatimonadetes bacterium]|nr:hypothetical protein [Gemmatimonadota bacterium]